MRLHRAVSVSIVTTLLCAACVMQSSAQPPARQVVVADFEDGVGEWRAVDDTTVRGSHARKCSINSSQQAAPNSGKQSARVDFTAAKSGWARVSMPVDGARWAEAGCSKLSFWLRGDGSGESIRIALRVRTGETEEGQETYTVPIKLSGTEWERYGLKFFGFRTADGALLPAYLIKNVDELQLAKSGSWKAFSLRIDGIAAEAEAEDIGAQSGNEVRPDFSKPTVPLRAQIGLDLGAPPTAIDDPAPGVAQGVYAAVSDLAPTVVRVKLGDYLDEDAQRYDLDMFRKHLEWIQLANCKPLICLDLPRVGKDTALRKKLYAAFLDSMARIVAEGKGGVGRYYELFDNPMGSGVFDSIEHMCDSYNKIVELIVATDPGARVGGPGFSAASREELEGFLKGAKTVHFVSFHFHGTHNPLTGTETLFRAACDTRPADTVGQLTFQQAKQLVAQLRPRGTPEVFVTEFAMTTAADEGGQCRDERVTGAFGGAWAAAAVLYGSPFVDKMVFHKISGGGWGMVSDAGQPETVYWALWLMKNYAARGAGRQQLFRIDEQTVAATIKTRTAYNVVICYAGSDPMELRIRPMNAPKLKMVRDRYIRDVDAQWMGTMRPTTADQTVQLDAPGVFVLQYIPAK